MKAALISSMNKSVEEPHLVNIDFHFVTGAGSGLAALFYLQGFFYDFLV